MENAALAAGVAIAFASPSASADVEVELDEPIVDAGAVLEEAGAIAEDEGNNILEEVLIEEVVLPLLFSTDTRPIMS